MRSGRIGGDREEEGGDGGEAKGGGGLMPFLTRMGEFLMACPIDRRIFSFFWGLAPAPDY